MLPAGIDVVDGVLELGRSRLRYVRPRRGDDLPPEVSPDGGEVYPPHWAQPWPAGIELARAVSAAPRRGLTVLELGCGLGLPAVAAALAGATVLATDRSAVAVEFAAANAHRNDVRVATAGCAWDAPGPVLAGAPWDLVLAADVLYGHRNVVELLDLLPRLVGDTGEVWLADPGRPLAAEFLAAARERWAVVRTVATPDPEVVVHRLRGRGPVSPRSRPAP